MVFIEVKQTTVQLLVNPKQLQKNVNQNVNLTMASLEYEKAIDLGFCGLP